MADSSSAPPSGQKAYKPLQDQVDQLKKAIHMACPGTLKTGEKLFRTMKDCVEKLCEAQ